ncbi:MAG: AmmeMemoRadiSam system protein A [Candidatus Pacearchaeota archaeon]|nr:AmmeMemoRadiSam system protein A [Candidatus Pacearchaeota archaeon]
MLKMLTQTQGNKLLELARKSIAYSFSGKPVDYEQEKQNFKEASGVFVTLTENNELRGCIGFPYPCKPLAQAIIEAARAAAFEDPRFRPLEEKELDKIKIEISILTQPQEIRAKGRDILKEINIGKDGLIVQFSGFSGLLLPQVALEHKWNALQFIEATCQKAGLPSHAWLHPQAHIFKFQAQIFSEEGSGKKRLRKTD